MVNYTVLQFQQFYIIFFFRIGSSLVANYNTVVHNEL